MSQNTIESTKKPKLVNHGSFIVERTYPQAPARVFFALADEASARRWRAEGEGFTVDEFKVDFRVGGKEVSRFRHQGGPQIQLDAVFHDIIPDQRIIFSSRMGIGPQPISVTLNTVELTPTGKGTLLKYTEQGVYFDDGEMLAGREAGTRELLEKLAVELQNAHK